jgi:hypothetical protein
VFFEQGRPMLDDAAMVLRLGFARAVGDRVAGGDVPAEDHGGDAGEPVAERSQEVAREMDDDGED